MNADPRASCRKLFKKSNILPFYLQYILSLLLVWEKTDFLQQTNKIHTINTHQSSNLHLSALNLAKYKKGVYYPGIKVFNQLPQDIKKLLHDVQKFNIAVKTFLLKETFYMIDEYYDWISRKDHGSL
jgi:hypothetical protein